ncbi:MAG: hypothetical protein ACT4OY_00855 [Alphaproteobacteria bacterium]
MAGSDFAQATIMQNWGKQAQKHGESYARSLAKELGVDPDTCVQRGPVKELKRIIEKAHGRENGIIKNVKDVVRFRILFNNPKQIEDLRKILRPGKVSSAFNQTWENRDVCIMDVDDYYAEPKKHGYIGLHLAVDTCIGKGRKSPVEIQLMHENMQLTDKVTREMYNEIRRIEETAQIENRELTENEKNTLIGYRSAT